MMGMNPKNFLRGPKFKNQFKSYAFLQNSLRDFWIFIFSHILKFLKNALPIIKKSVWWSFKNKKIWDVLPSSAPVTA